MKPVPEPGYSTTVIESTWEKNKPQIKSYLNMIEEYLCFLKMQYDNILLLEELQLTRGFSNLRENEILCRYDRINDSIKST